LAATVFDKPVAQSYGAATYYSMFSVKPRSKNVTHGKPLTWLQDARI